MRGGRLELQGRERRKLLPTHGDGFVCLPLIANDPLYAWFGLGTSTSPANDPE